MAVTQAPRQHAPTSTCLALLAAGEHEAAIQACARAFEEDGDPQAGAAAAEASLALGRHGDVHAWRARLHGTLQEAWALTLAGVAHRREGELRRAEDDYRAACRIHRAGSNAPALCGNLLRLFRLAWDRSDFRLALSYADEALTAALASGRPELVAMAAEGLFALLYDVGDLEGARAVLDAFGTDGGDGAGSMLNNRGLVHLAGGREALAQMSFDAALDQAAEAGDRDLVRCIHLNLAEAALRRGDAEGARESVRAAEEHADPHGRNRVALLYYMARSARSDGHVARAEGFLREALASEASSDWTWQLHHELGLLHEARGEDREAERAFARACDVLEEMRRALGFADFKAWLLERKRASFEALFARQAARPDGAVAALATSERVRLRHRVDELLGGDSEGAAPGVSALAALRAVLSRADERIETLRALVPAVGMSRATANLAADELVSGLADLHVLALFGARDAVWSCRVHGGSIRIRRLEGSRRSLAALARRFAADPDDAAVARHLGAALLPGDTLPERGATLHLVPDGPFVNVPFAALRIGNERLIERHTLVRWPNLTLIHSAMARKAHDSASPVIIGDPGGDLPAARREAQDVARILAAPALVGPEAVAARMLSSAGTPSVLHLATHGGLSAHGYWVQAADRKVAAAEIMQAGRAARLTVLATCASASQARVHIARPLAHAFLLAGSEAVVGTLWSVEDADARRMVMQFYQAGGAEDPAAALARCQRRAIAAGRPPSSWSAYVVEGMVAPAGAASVDHGR